MVFSFSGTGNSQFVAEKISEITSDKITDLNLKIKDNDTSGIECGENVIIVAPTYAWRLPKIVTDWLEKTDLINAKNAWFVMTCGGEIGNAAKYNKLLCEKKNLKYMGTYQILMPENYIAMFKSPGPDEAKKMIAKSVPDIEKAAEIIKSKECFPVPRNNAYDRLMSSAINPMFYSMFVKADAFYAKDSCNGCGKCVKLCPLNNIVLKDNKPAWGKNCTHCMACICHCPAEAIEYGNKSKGKPRYQCRL